MTAKDIHKLLLRWEVFRHVECFAAEPVPDHTIRSFSCGAAHAFEERDKDAIDAIMDLRKELKDAK